MTREAAVARREGILQAARWCFLNFGFSKTSLDDIAKRANISRTLLYKSFRDKEDTRRHALAGSRPVMLVGQREAGPRNETQSSARCWAPRSYVKG
ncbi:helix-turn-helix domain containing protein [Ralstonia solanacearum]|nr:helix-turn-helix domain containing protein [Ralstonia solanacearum]